MRLIITLLFLLSFVVSSQAQVQRIPLHEGFTSSTCGPCAPGNANANSIYSTAPHKQIILRYQMSWPGSGDPYYTAEGQTRRSYYGINSVPTLEIDGAGDYNTNIPFFTAAIRDNAYNVPAFMTIDVDYEVRCKTMDIDVTVKALQAFSGNNILHLAIIEQKTFDNLKSNGETEFLNVMKKMVPGAGGTSLGALSNGDSLSFSFSHTFPGNYRLPPNANSPINNATEHSVEEFYDLQVVAWVQNSGSKAVHQSTYGTDQINIDATISELTMPFTMPINGVSIEGKIQNWQNTIINSATIFYSVDGGPAESMNISGMVLDIGDKAPFVHNVAWVPPSTGTYTLKVWSGNINGGIDEVPCNDTITQVITIVPLIIVPQADFVWGGGSLAVNFINASIEDPLDPSSYQWDFGDGTFFSFVENPSHTFPSAGTYSTCLTVFNTVGNDTKCQDVTVPLVGLQDQIDKNVLVYPNPSSGVFKMENNLNEEIRVELVSPNGERIGIYLIKSKDIVNIDLNGNSPGIYLAKFQTSKGESVKKLNLK